MAFGRKKGNPQLNAFGPLDTLIAASQTLLGTQRDFVTGVLLNEAFVDAAVDDGRTLSREEVERFDQVCRIGFANAMAIAKQRNRDSSSELEAARRLVAGCLKCQPHEVDLNANREGFALALTTIKGGSRMLQLKRDEQAMAAIALGTMLVRFACVADPGDTTIYVASWGPEGKNKCTFYVQPDLSISWTPETDEPALFAQDNVVAALSELERALGKDVSFQDELEANNDFVRSLIESGAVTFETSSEPFFKWNPPLPQRGKEGGI